MTTINAMKFNKNQGIMVCDEIRSWNDEDMKMNSADKIKPVISENVSKEIKLFGAYGNTGTSSVGDELRMGIRNKIDAYFYEYKKIHRELPVWNNDYIASVIWEVMTEMKKNHTDQYLKAKYGFGQDELIQGYYYSDGEKIEINEEISINKVYEAMTFENKDPEIRPIFANGGIYSGYDDELGIRIYQFSLMNQYYEPVDICFSASGSGSDTAGRKLSTFVSNLDYGKRTGNLDQETGTLVLLAAIEEASNVNIGVGGYNNILVLDATKNKKNYINQINDHRSKLATEISSAHNKGILELTKARNLIRGLIFENDDFKLILSEFNDFLEENKKNDYFFRGYK